MNGIFLFLATIIIPGLGQTSRIFFFLPLLRFKGKIELNVNLTFVIIVAIAILSQLNLMFSYFNGIRTETEITIQQVMSFNLLMPIAYIIAQQFKASDLRIFIWLFVIDALFVIAQSYYGVSTFYNIEGFETFVDVDNLVYFNRPFGLGNNASVFAEKLVAFVLIVHMLATGYGYRFPKIAIAIVAFAGLVNFGRTAFVAIFFFLAVTSVIKLVKISTIERAKYLIIGSIVTAFVFVFYRDNIYMAVEEALRQFTRGNDALDLAGRDLIWNDYTSFIRENIIFGNGSVKYFTDYFGQQATAHNSFLMISASHGLIIAILYAVAILSSLNRKNVVYIATIIIFSFAQYSIFWGLSFNDIILFYFMSYGNESRLRKLSLRKAPQNIPVRPATGELRPLVRPIQP